MRSPVRPVCLFAVLALVVACTSSDDATVKTASPAKSASSEMKGVRPPIAEGEIVRLYDWSLAETPLDRDATGLRASTATNLGHAQELYGRILAQQGPRTVGNTFVLYNEMLMHIDASMQECSLLGAVHPIEDVRNAADEGEQRMSEFVTELSLSRELYDALASIDTDGVDAETVFALEKELRDFRRAGVDRSPEERERISELNAEITKLGQDWQRNISDDVREITLESVLDLEGLPRDYIENHPVGEDGLIRINTTYPDYIPFMRYAKSAEARERLYDQYNNRAFPANLEVLMEVLRKRYELAQLLGYDNYAEYITADKMIGSATNAQEFIDRIHDLSRATAEHDVGRLLDRKMQDDPSARRIQDWEKAYYGELVKADMFDFDSQEVRPYFNFEAVQQGLFDLTSRLFGVRYEQVEGLDLWSDDVTAWDLFDGNGQIGRFYLDLHPRANKYGHAACFGYREGVEGRRLPQAALVCNFPDPSGSDDGVALMTHGEVTTFFHEFGHLLHAMFAGHHEWIGVGGINTEWDFVEAPSQLLEEWCYEEEALSVFARHYETGEVIPSEMVEKLRLSEEFGKGSNTAHQMFYAALSLNYYNRSPDDVDLVPLMVELRERYTPFPHVDDTYFNASFGHLYGYSAIYYTYMWSQVIAKDMHSRFVEEGMMNEETARAYRREVLEPGGSKPAAELVEGFLGRPFSFEAFEAYMAASEDGGGPSTN